MISTRVEKAAQSREIIADLRQLIEALDRRVPRLERIGEAQIAQEASDLREQALSLIQRLRAAIGED